MHSYAATESKSAEAAPAALPAFARATAGLGNQLLLRARGALDARRPGLALGNRAALGALGQRPQAKLTIGAVDDPQELEADRVADRVMRTPSADAAPVCAKCSTSPRQVQRACATCDDELVRREVTHTSAPAPVASAPPIVASVLQSPGQALDARARSFMEPRFGRSFADVRVHHDAQAAASASAVSALAYTLGSHIVFAPGQYDPGSTGGLRLLAHELTHVVQQEGRPATTMQRAVTRGYFAPSFIVTPAIASLFGTVAEVAIEADYLAMRGGVPFGDVFLDGPMGSIAYIAFLAAHHPSLDVTLLAAQIGLSGGVLIPDILDARVHELYEVKPDSVDGRAAGRGKLFAIEAFMAFNTLPYIPGLTYTPTPTIPLPLTGAALTSALTMLLGPAAAAAILLCGLPVVTLAPRRLMPGLLVYEVCIEADFACYASVAAVAAIIAAIIIAIILSDGIVIPALPELIPVLTPVVPVLAL